MSPLFAPPAMHACAIAVSQPTPPGVITLGWCSGAAFRPTITACGFAAGFGFLVRGGRLGDHDTGVVCGTVQGWEPGGPSASAGLWTRAQQRRTQPGKTAMASLRSRRPIPGARSGDDTPALCGTMRGIYLPLYLPMELPTASLAKLSR